MAACPRLYGGLQCIEPVHVTVKGVHVFLYNLHWFQLLLPGFLFNPVFTLFCVFIFKMPYICYIPYITDFITEMNKVTVKEIKYNGRPGMTQVCVAVDSRPANVQSDKWGVQGFEFFFTARQAVIDE
jgi:hypothetical protein